MGIFALQARPAVPAVPPAALRRPPGDPCSPSTALPAFLCENPDTGLWTRPFMAKYTDLRSTVSLCKYQDADDPNGLQKNTKFVNNGIVAVYDKCRAGHRCSHWDPALGKHRKTMGGKATGANSR